MMVATSGKLCARLLWKELKAPRMLVQVLVKKDCSPESAPVKKPVTVDHNSEMPLNRPRIRFFPMSAKMVDGEWIPKIALTPLMMLRKKFLILPINQP